MLQRAAQFVTGAVDIGLHCAEGEVEDLGDFLVGVPLHMAQQDAGAILGPELGNDLLDITAQLYGRDRVESAFAPRTYLQRGRLHRLRRDGVG